MLLTLVVIGFYFRTLYSWLSEPSHVSALLILLVVLVFVLKEDRHVCESFHMDLIWLQVAMTSLRTGVPLLKRKFSVCVGGCLCVCMYLGVCFPVCV